MVPIAPNGNGGSVGTLSTRFTGLLHARATIERLRSGSIYDTCIYRSISIVKLHCCASTKATDHYPVTTFAVHALGRHVSWDACCPGRLPTLFRGGLSPVDSRYHPVCLPAITWSSATDTRPVVGRGCCWRFIAGGWQRRRCIRRAVGFVRTGGPGPGRD